MNYIDFRFEPIVIRDSSDVTFFMYTNMLAREVEWFDHAFYLSVANKWSPLAKKRLNGD